ncbi:MAG: HPr family phosphocarrier protein [Clostridiales bacterium]|nr:HPr family phosphocarrier protein [Clostridiales bacterium]
MISKTITIQLPSGLEARPIAMLVQVASQYESSIYLQSEQRKVNAKSIMGMMTLGLNAGEKVTVCVNGKDENDAICRIEEYLSGK